MEVYVAVLTFVQDDVRIALQVLLVDQSLQHDAGGAEKNLRVVPIRYFVQSDMKSNFRAQLRLPFLRNTLRDGHCGDLARLADDDVAVLATSLAAVEDVLRNLRRL